MKRFLKRAAVFLIPFIIIFALFFAFEPYDYFGVKGDAAYASMPLSSMREIMIEKPARIILGDSTMANLNTGYIRELTGLDYTMLGFGGAQLGECIELFWFAAENTKLRECVFGMDFYSSGAEQDEGRVAAIEKRANSVFDFTFHVNYWLESVNTAKYKTKNLLGGILGKPSWIEYPEDPTSFYTQQNIPSEMGDRYRLDLEEYAALINGRIPDDFTITDETYEKLFEITDYCDANGIKLTFVFPPMHVSIHELVINARGLNSEIARLKETLSERADTVDLLFLNEFTEDDGNFFDGFHLASPMKRLLAELIFTDTPSEYIVRHERQG